jgi:hypothetical protein
MPRGRRGRPPLAMPRENDSSPGAPMMAGAMLGAPLLGAEQHAGTAAAHTTEQKAQEGSSSSSARPNLFDEANWDGTSLRTRGEAPALADEPPQATIAAGAGGFDYWLPLAVLWAGVFAALSVWPQSLWAWQSQPPGSCEARADLDKWLSASAVGGRMLLTFGSVAGSQVLKMLWQPQKVWSKLPARLRSHSCWGAADADASPEELHEQQVTKVLTLALTPPEAREQARPAIDDFMRQLSDRHAQEVVAAEKSLFMTLWTGRGANISQSPVVGWKAITGEGARQSSWDDAQLVLGLSRWQGMLLTMGKLLMWHLSQPLAYLYIFHAYYCTLSRQQQVFGSVVAAREVIYLATAVAGLYACPVYLLLDLETAWGEAETVGEGAVNLAMYILTPQNYVAKCISSRYSATAATGGDASSQFQETLTWCGFVALGALAAWLCCSSMDAGPGQLGFGLLGTLVVCLLCICSGLKSICGCGGKGVIGRVRPPKLLLLGLVAAQVVADCASCFALGVVLSDDIAGTPSPFALKIGYSLTALGFLLFFGPLSGAKSPMYPSCSLHGN